MNTLKTHPGYEHEWNTLFFRNTHLLILAIVSTTLTTVTGFIPLLLFIGGEFWPPLAVVIAGGVAFSITLSLLFTPALYALIFHHRHSLFHRLDPVAVQVEKNRG